MSTGEFMSTGDPMKMSQIIINCNDLSAELDFFTSLGFKLLQVFPADNPRMMLLSTEGLTLRLEKNGQKNTMTLLLPGTTITKQTRLVSPHGVVVQVQQALESSSSMPDPIEFSINRFDAENSWVIGRAGMLYRDLIPDRLGGSMIASNIMIPDGGPVPDHVHFHSIQFQLIFCVHGWVKVVYEDQGDPFVLHAGDCVTQPPGIRHQVLESSDGLEVVEIGLPAEHMTVLDYTLKLPTGGHLPDRLYGAKDDNQQKFCHHQQTHADWQTDSHTALLTCKTDVELDCGGLAAVHVLKRAENNKQIIELCHQDAVRFYYIIAGQFVLKSTVSVSSQLSMRDSFVLPPGMAVEFSDCSDDFQCIEFILR